jgi:hypothetical protein
MISYENRVDQVRADIAATYNQTARELADSVQHNQLTVVTAPFRSGKSSTLLPLTSKALEQKGFKSSGVIDLTLAHQYRIKLLAAFPHNADNLSLRDETVRDWTRLEERGAFNVKNLPVWRLPKVLARKYLGALNSHPTPVGEPTSAEILDLSTGLLPSNP